MDYASGSRVDGKDRGGGGHGSSSGSKKRGIEMGVQPGRKKLPWEPRRGPGIAKLEEMNRIREELMEQTMRSRNHHFHQQPPSAAPGGTYGLWGNEPSLPPYQHQQQQPPQQPPPPPYAFPPPFLRRNLPSSMRCTVVSKALPSYSYQPAAYGRGSAMPNQTLPNCTQTVYGTGSGASGYYTLPLVRPLVASGAASNANPSNVAPTTLPLFKETPDHVKEGESACVKRGESHNPSAGEPSRSKGSKDPSDDLNLDLKL